MDHLLLAVTNGSVAKGSAKDLEVAGSGPVHCHFWGAEGAPILFSDLGIDMASCPCIYIQCKLQNTRVLKP